MKKINLEEKVEIKKVAKVEWQTQTGNGIDICESYNGKLETTRKELIKTIGFNLLPPFQHQNLHHGFSVVEGEELKSWNTPHYNNVVKMNDIIDKMLAGAKKITFTKEYLAADQVA